MGDLSEHFSRHELACPHCGVCELDARLVPALEQLRAAAGVPIVVHDAYRCEAHNKAVGGVAHSQHPMGMAADVGIEGKTLKEMYELATSVPDFAGGGIGLYDGGFVHVDVRKGAARWARVNGKYVGIGELLKDGGK